jgi:protease-4
MSDYLLDRIHLKSKLSFWRNTALVILALSILYFISDFRNGSTSTLQKPFIARITINEEIKEDINQELILNKLAENDKAQAVILHLNTSGGTVYGGENLYYSLLKIAKKKPVVAVIGTCATSAGYMIALAADSIIARNTSLIGSIGTIIVTQEISELAKKLGVEFIILKSGDLKAEPLFTHKLTEQAKEATMQTIMDTYNIFVDIVSERRKMPKNQVLKLADGRVFTGNQAFKNQLIDAIGGEDEAIQWLVINKNVTKDLPVKDIPLESKDDIISEFIAPLSKLNTILDYALSLVKSTHNIGVIQ